MDQWWNRAYLGSAEDMRQIPDASVHTTVCSPPYYALRDYNSAVWIGGDDSCDHVRHKAGVHSLLTGGLDGYERTYQHVAPYKGDRCGRCGALRVDEQIGLERTPEEYIDRLVAVFREVYRVLRPDGTLWLNLGDSYTAGTVGRKDGHRRNAHGAFANGVHHERQAGGGGRPRLPPQGVKKKNLLGIPWRVAFALQENGWYLRDAIVWAKSNAMPASVRDRCTSSYELIFLLTKKPRYFIDMQAVRELSGGSANLRNVWNMPTRRYLGAHFATFPRELPARCIRLGTSDAGCCSACGKPWSRVTETTYQDTGRRTNGPRSISNRDTTPGFANRKRKVVRSLGFAPKCSCDAPAVPCVVLDPFLGSGTVAEVAIGHGRRFVGYELSREYHALIESRLGLFKDAA
jgi:DNA modification methylase